jgi:hypothetical protein
MPYVKRPFNPLISIENQVISELEQANYNFEALANVFVGEDPIAGGVVGYEYGTDGIGLAFFTSKWKPSFQAWTSFGTFTFPVAMSVIL